MVKIRVEGLSEEVKELIQSFYENYDVLSVSEEYRHKNKQVSQYIRVYVEMRLKRRNT